LLSISNAPNEALDKHKYKERIMEAYALTLCANKIQDGLITASYTAQWGIATDEVTMYQIGLEKAQRIFPSSDGYRDHQVTLSRIDGRPIEVGDSIYILRIEER
jgi:hypothetical protein